MKTIPLTKGKLTQVADESHELVAKFKWQAIQKGGAWYAARTFGKSRVYLHQLLLVARPGEEIDHIDGDGLNNQLNNLRSCSHAQNLRARCRKREGASSKFRGVFWFKRDQNWAAQIFVQGRSTHLGYFIDEEDAARAYDTAAIKHFGEFAAPNFPAELLENTQ